MTTVRLESRRNMTDSWLRNLKDTGRRTEYSDTLQKGLRLRVGAQGERTFLLKARGGDGRMATVTLGPYPMLSLKDARQKAMACLLAIKNGEEHRLRGAGFMAEDMGSAQLARRRCKAEDGGPHAADWCDPAPDVGRNAYFRLDAASQANP